MQLILGKLILDKGALGIAIEKKNNNVVRILLDNGAHVNHDVLQTAKIHGTKRILQMIKETIQEDSVGGRFRPHTLP